MGAVSPARLGAGLLALILALTAGRLPAQTLQLNPAEGLLRRPAAATAPAPVTAPPAAQGYLYVETHQARFEALFDAATVLRFLDPGAAVPQTLSPEAQTRLCQALAGKAEAWCRLWLGKQALPARFAAPTMVRGKPGATLPMDSAIDLPVAEALVGLLWEFPTPPIPEELTVEWRGFELGPAALPVRVFFGSLSEPGELVKSFPRLLWRNRDRLPRPAPLAPVPPLEVAPQMQLPLATLLWSAGCLALLIVFTRRDLVVPGGLVTFAGVWLLGALLLWPMLAVRVALPRFSRPAAVSDPAAAQAVVAPLLRNAYRAFDHRSESAIYDVLARSVDGELLRRLYLETLQALTLEGREGTRVTLREFDASVAGVEPAAAGFIADCEWTALGTVGHWGHSHTRVNRYTARVTVQPVQGEWKLTDLEVREARRL